MSRTDYTEQSDYKTFAWSGFSFQIPGDWNLAYYNSYGSSQSLRLEDDEALRMEIDWVASDSKAIDPSAIQKKQAKLSNELMEAGAELEAFEKLPSGWAAFLYTMPDKRKLLAAFSLFNGNSRLCFFRVHFESASRREALRILNITTSTFEVHADGPVPWDVYDVSFQSPENFKLASTSFQPGQKIFSFVWNLRRLYYMFFSLGDMALKDKRVEEWCADFLNNFKEINGRFFSPGQNGVINVRRSRSHPFGHIEDVYRWCFNYKAHCRYDQDKNQIAIVLFNYRSIRDLDLLQRASRPTRQGGQ